MNFQIVRTSVIISRAPGCSAEVTVVTIYGNVMPERINKIDLSEVDTVVFTSPSCVRNFKKIYKDIPGHVKYISRGFETENEMLIAGIKNY